MDVRLDEVPVPEIVSEDDLLIEVSAAGICGTDIEEWTHGPLNIPEVAHPLTGRHAPLTLGHEFVGRVVDAGPAAAIEVGTLVAVEVNVSCGSCAACEAGDSQLCPKLASSGLHDDGGLADYVRVPESICAVVPADVGVLDAVLSEPLAVAVRACDRSGLRPGDTVAVLGGGAVGQLVSQVARARGARVVLVEPLPQRRKLAADLGAEFVVDVLDAMDAVGSEGADVAIESAGASAAIADAAKLTRPGGRIVLLGVNNEPIPVTPLELILKEQTLSTSLSHTMADFTRAVELIASSAVRVRSLVTDVVPLSRAVADGLTALHEHPQDHLKVVVVPDEKLESTK